MLNSSARHADMTEGIQDAILSGNPWAESVKLMVVGGVAYLDGAVASFQEKRALASTVATLPNVREVVNRLHVVPGCPRTDRQVTEGVINALKKEPALSFQRVAVSASDGVVEIQGQVPGIAARIAAEAAAWSVPGVRHVINRLEVAGQAPPDPDELVLLLKHRLESCLGAAASGVELRFQDGAVYITGSVPGLEQRQAAEDLIHWDPLVREVINQLAVGKGELSELSPSA
ncbi:MAG: BON domain-containing protein [Chloroflexi bacterium]|nr:BON domain-containing protein [Chloroflexota bacterium]